MREASPDRPGSPCDTVLIVEGSEFTRHRLRAALGDDDRQVYLAATVAEALAAIRAHAPQLLLVSLDLSDLPGPRVVEVLRQRAGGAGIIALGRGSPVRQAVAAARHGARDYLDVQDDVDEVRSVAGRVLRSIHGGKRSRGAVLRPGTGHLLTQNAQMMDVLDRICKVAQTNAPVRIEGEEGTGRESVAQAIHDRSRRRGEPFVSVRCGASPPEASSPAREALALEGALFGTADGSQDGAVVRAAGGTLFLGELDRAPHQVQAQVLELLEDGVFRRGDGGRLPVDVRIVAATGPRLQQAVGAGTFRSDLFYRLDAFPIALPPLRERPEDIPLLMRHFLDRLSLEHERRAPAITAAAMAAILTLPWPGNVRQLRALCEGWVIAGRRIEVDALPRKASVGADGTEPIPIDPSATLKENATRALEAVERAYLDQVLAQCGGHLGRTADAAGITRRTLYTKMRQYDLHQGSYRPSR